MKKSYLLLFTICLFSGTLSSQDGIFKFVKTGSYTNLVETLSDSLGNMYISGKFRDNFTYDGISITGTDVIESTNAYILKVFPNGKPVYLKPIIGNGTENSVNIQNIAVNDRGELAAILTAPSIDAISVGGRSISLSANETNQVVLKFSKNGYLMWARRIRVSGTSAYVSAQDVEIDNAGNVYVAGSFYGTSATIGSFSLEGLSSKYAKLFLAKYSPEGTELWASTCGVTNDTVTDTTGEITANHLILSKTNRIYISGNVTGNRRYVFGINSVKNQGVSNAYLACFYTTGDVAWIRKYTGDGTIIPGDMITDKNDNIIFSCFYQSDTLYANGNTFASPVVYNLLVSKYEPTNNFLWNVNRFIQLPFANYSGSDVHLFTDDTSHVLVIGNYYSGGINRFYALKLLNDNGIVNWTRYSNNTSAISFNDVAGDLKGNIYLTGIVYNPFSFNGYAVSASSGYGTNYLLKFDANGDPVFGYQKENSTNSSLYFSYLGVNNYGNTMITGTYSGSEIALDSTVTVNEKTGMFVTRYCHVGKISGTVTNTTGNPLSNGYVKLLGYSYYQRCPLSDSVRINENGSYAFNNVPLGEYILYASPGPMEGKEYIPAFYLSAGHWEDAVRLKLDKQFIFENIDILTSQMFAMEGQGTIQGKVTEIGEDDIFKSVMNKPRAKSKASLAKSSLKSDYEIILVTVTDENGDFYFNNVENGDYFVLIEEPGLPDVSVHNITISGNSYYSNVDYLVNEDNIEAVGEPVIKTGIEDLLDIQGISVFPNPSSGLVSVVSSESDPLISLTVFGIDGKIIVQNKSIQDYNVTIELEPGLYMIQVKTNVHCLTQKLVIRN